MGLEALSRGARRCVFVESDRAACAAIRGNLEKLAPDGRDSCSAGTRSRLSREERGAGRRYDLVLVDPPYRTFSDRANRPRRPTAVASSPRTALAVVETAAKEEPELPLDVGTSRRYGSARLTALRRR